MEETKAPISLQDELNESQLEAVTYCDGPALVIAGAGSGKTRVLTFKIAYLLQLGYEPWSILSLTFTNKASREMNERIAQIVGDGFTKQIWSGTFHSVFSRILRKEAAFLGFTSQFTIYDTADSRALIKLIIKEMGLDEKTYKPATIHNIISDAKNRLVLPDAYAADKEANRLNSINGIKEAAKIYKEYFIRCKRANAMDFDDLLLYTFILFRDFPDVAERYKQRFRYILVDEYQDTNYAQHKIITMIAPPDAKIFVVGDDAQSIYSFRGANIDNILRFNKQYPTARLIKLERNYRSTQNIVEAANSVIRHNRNQIPKTVYSENETGQKIKVLSAHSDKEESLKICGEIKQLMRREQLGYEQIAILYRTNAQSRSFEDTMRNYNIPYRIYGGLSFYQRKEIRDVLAYLRVICNSNDDEALRRIINYPARGIGKTTMDKLLVTARESSTPLWDVVCDPLAFHVDINKGTLAKLSNFSRLIELFRDMTATASAYEVAKAVIRDAGIAADIMQERNAENLAKQENLEELLNAIKSYQDDLQEETGQEHFALADYLSQVSLLTDADQKDDNQPKVTMMTIHAAKGLEFDAVFVTGMEDDLFPNSNARFFPREMEEERRLFYVAITRAKRFCYLTYATSRYKFGNMEFCTPSSFLREIDQKYLQTEDTIHTFERPEANRNPRPQFFQELKKPSPQRENTPAPPSPPTRPMTGMKRIVRSSAPSANSESLSTSQGTLACGTRIEHERFGCGEIIRIEGNDANSKISVRFDSGETKNLLIKFAKFKLL